MAAEDGKDLVGRWARAFNERDWACEAACRTEDFTAHVQGAPGPLDGKGWVDYLDTFVTAFRCLCLQLDDVIAEGDVVASRWRMTGNHEGEFLGQFATGHRVVIAGIDFSRIEDGRLAERWLQLDGLGVLAQLGGIRASSEPARPAP